MLLKNVRIYPVVGTPYETGYILIENGKIASLGDMKDCPKTDGTSLDVSGLTAYPGFIDSHCHIGVGEEGIGWEGRDYNEMVDPVTPHMSVKDGINPKDTSFALAMKAGVTTAVISPGSANVIGGTVVAAKTAPKKRVEDMLLKDHLAMKMALGENPKRVYGQTANKTPYTRMGSAAVMREALSKAKTYMESDKKTYDAKSEALIPVLKREVPVHVHAHRADDIFTAVRVMKEFNLEYTIIHCTEGYLIADELKAENVKAITGPHFSSRSKYELVNNTEAAPGILYQHGMRVAICTDHPVIPLEFLNIAAGICVKEGLSFENAIEAITIVPAEICGLSDRVGSLEAGKDADILLYDQDPLSSYAKPKYVFIDGETVSAPTK